MKHFLLLTFILFTSCDYIKSKDSDKQISKAIEDISKLLETSKNESIKELEKIHQFEYKTHLLEFDVDNPKTSAVEISATLNEYSKARWNCFEIEKIKKDDKVSFLFFLKRPTDTPLRYLPNSIINK